MFTIITVHDHTVIPPLIVIPIINQDTPKGDLI